MRFNFKSAKRECNSIPILYNKKIYGMKKSLLCFMAFALICSLSLSSCGGGDDETDKPDTSEIPDNPNTPDNPSTPDLLGLLSGVWTDGDFFVSFDKEEKYLAACIAPRYIDNGRFIIDEKAKCITVENPYYNVSNKYTVISISSDELKLKVDYLDQWGEAQTLNLTLEHSDCKATPKENSWYGKTITTFSSYFGNVKYDFYTYYTGKKTASKGNALKYPVSYYYITKEKTIYLMEIPESQIPSVGGWNVDNYEVQVITYTLNETGGYDFHSKNLAD